MAQHNTDSMVVPSDRLAGLAAGLRASTSHMVTVVREDRHVDSAIVRRTKIPSDLVCVPASGGAEFTLRFDRDVNAWIETDAKTAPRIAVPPMWMPPAPCRRRKTRPPLPDLSAGREYVYTNPDLMTATDESGRHEEPVRVVAEAHVPKYAEKDSGLARRRKLVSVVTHHF